MSCEVPQAMRDYRRRLQVLLEAQERLLGQPNYEMERIQGEIECFDFWDSAHRQRCPECVKKRVFKFATGLAEAM